MPGPGGWFTRAQGRETAVLPISVVSAVQCVPSAIRTRSNELRILVARKPRQNPGLD
jgi:hypothetical protein